MWFEPGITKENMNWFFKELAKEYRKLSGKAIPAEIILIGGAAVLANYGFRETTYDIDAIIAASSAMKGAANKVGDKLGLPSGWLNFDFRRTCSYSDKLPQVSVFYKTYSNILTIRAISAEYLIAMKLMAGRRYKFDLSDVAGILWEHEKIGHPVARDDIDRAINELYGGWQDVPQISRFLLDAAYESGDFESVYRDIRKSEVESKEILLDFIGKHQGTLNSDNIDAILEEAKTKRREGGQDE